MYPSLFYPQGPWQNYNFLLNMLTHKNYILKIVYWVNSVLGPPAASWSLTQPPSWSFLPFIIKLGIPLTLSCIKFFISWILVFFFFFFFYSPSSWWRISFSSFLRKVLREAMFLKSCMWEVMFYCRLTLD